MGDFVSRIPEGDDRERLVCNRCGFIDYRNPRVIVGSVVGHEGHVLLCRRAIEPRACFWTLPAGFLELGETAAEGAAREAWEEARARLAVEGVLALYSIPRIGQVQILFRARFAGPPLFAPGPETRETGLFAWDQVPWAEIAFPSVRWALAAWRERDGKPLAAPATNPTEDSAFP